jgi:CheY-like chemotaxis protein
LDPSEKTTAAVLIVDDQEYVRQFTYVALRARGVRCWLAPNGEAAVAILKAHTDEIGAAIVDLKMPEMDGLATVAALRAVNPDLACLLVTGGAGLDETSFLASGAVGVISKPYIVDQLCSALVSRLGGDRPG